MEFLKPLQSPTTLLKQLARYFWVAFVGLGIDFGTLIAATEWFHLPYLLSAALGFSLGLIANFFLSERFVFQDPTIQHPGLRFALYAVVGLIGLGILTALMWVQVELFAISYVLAKVISTVLVYLWNFFARRGMYRV